MSAGLEVIDASRPPLFVGAGVIKSEEQILYFSQEELLAAQVIGSYSESAWDGNDPTGQKTVFWWDEKSGAAYNAIGLRNCGRKAASLYLPGAIQQVQDAGQAAILAVTSLKHEDSRIVVPDLVEWALEMGADGVEINGSCPNEGSHDVLCADIGKTYETLMRARERVGTSPYILLKVSALGEVLIRHYQESGLLGLVNGISAINNCRRLAPPDPATGVPTIEVNEGYAGQSGPAINELARESLAAWADHSAERGESAAPPGCDIWSIGGVTNGQEAYHRIRHMGASMVGGAQEFYRSDNPREVVQRWAQEYREASASGSS